jgi:DNA-directed RNA polymerase specialized sigma24 family protein
MNTKEFQRILSSLPPEEQAVIFWWRIWFYPKVLSAEEISLHVGLDPTTIHNIIVRLNRHCRLKLELACFLSVLKREIFPDIDNNSR